MKEGFLEVVLKSFEIEKGSIIMTFNFYLASIKELQGYFPRRKVLMKVVLTR